MRLEDTFTLTANANGVAVAGIYMSTKSSRFLAPTLTSSDYPLTATGSASDPNYLTDLLVQFDQYRIASCGAEIMYTGPADTAAGVIYLKTSADNNPALFPANISTSELHSDRFSVQGPPIRWVGAPIGGAALDFVGVEDTGVRNAHTHLWIMCAGMTASTTITVTVVMNIEALPKFNTTSAWLLDQGHGSQNDYSQMARAMGKQALDYAGPIILSALRQRMMGTIAHAYRAGRSITY
jgi:hypothetical protein